MTVDDKPKTRRRKAARPGEIVQAGLAGSQNTGLSVLV